MLKTSRLAALVILGIIAASPAYAENKPAEDKPAAKVSGISIPQERVDLRVKIVHPPRDRLTARNCAKPSMTIWSTSN